MVFFVVLSFVTLTTATFAKAQCGQYQSRTITCGGSNNCQQTISVNYPIIAQYGVNLSYFFVQCCDSQLLTYYIIPGVCDDAELKDPVVKQSLAELSLVQPLLVANCTGQFRPYHVPSGPLINKESVNDRSLRKSLNVPMS